MEKQKIEILKNINMITPESIHINSFMYEPIIDMTPNELVAIFSKSQML